MRYASNEDAFMAGFDEPRAESRKQWEIWENHLAHVEKWGGMENDPHDHCDALYDIPYVRAGLEEYQRLVPESAGNVIEFGCAQGYILNHVGGRSTRRTGVDFSEGRVAKGRAQYPDTHFIVGDVLTVDIGGTYEYVLLPGILEHVRFQEARALLERAWDLCAPGGLIIFDLPFWDGKSGSFNSGIHMNPTHAWVATYYRWDWLFRGFDVQKLTLGDYPFYVLGSIQKRAPAGTLVGCWGKIGDIIHSMPMAQELARRGDLVHVAYSVDYYAVGNVLDMLEGIDDHSAEEYAWGEHDLGIVGDKWDRVVNASHNMGRPDSTVGRNIFEWWNTGSHSIDFHAANAGLELSGQERLLTFKPGKLRKRRSKQVMFLSNTGDAVMRGIEEAWWKPVVKKVEELGFKAIECSLGPLCNGEDKRDIDLGKMVRLMSGVRLVISVDTLASALLAQSVNTPIIRLYTGTHDGMTGAVLKSPTARSVKGTPPDVKEVIRHVEELLSGGS